MDLKKILPIAIIVVAVLSLVAYAAFKPAETPQTSLTNTGVPGVTGQVPSTPSQTPSQAPAQAPQAAALPADTKPVSSKEPATIVPDGMTLEQFCEKYYSAWVKKDWNTAFELLPVNKKNGLDPTSLGQRNEGYGLTSYKVQKQQVNGNVGTVIVEMSLGDNGIWSTNWTFIKNDKGQWTAQDSKVGMMQ